MAAEKELMYWRSIKTGQIYETDFVPMGVGWEQVSKADYLAWKKAMGI